MTRETCQKQFCDELTFKSKWWCKQCDWPLLPLSISLCTNVYHEAIHRMKELLEHSTEGILVEGLCVCEMVTGAEAHQGAWGHWGPEITETDSGTRVAYDNLLKAQNQGVCAFDLVHLSGAVQSFFDNIAKVIVVLWRKERSSERYCIKDPKAQADTVNQQNIIPR